jgi:hypothetical protein
LLLTKVVEPPGQRITCVVPFDRRFFVPPVTVTFIVPAFAEQPQVGSVTVIDETDGAPTAENTALIVQLPPFPPLGGNDQLIGLVKGAFKTTLPPHELVIVKVPVVGREQPIVNTPDMTKLLLTHGPAVAVKVLQLGAVYVVGNMDGDPEAEYTAETVQFSPFPHRFGMV